MFNTRVIIYLVGNLKSVSDNFSETHFSASALNSSENSFFAPPTPKQ